MVRDMSYMFFHATSFNQPIGSWNVNGVNDMERMFFGRNMEFNQPLGDWKLNCGCLTRDMFHDDFRNSRPVEESCCTIS